MKSLNFNIAFLTCILSLLLSCKDPEGHFTNSIAATQKPLTIDIQPFEGMPKNLVTAVYKKLQKLYPSVQLNTAIKLPDMAFYEPRNRYRADSLIRYLKTITPKGHISIGLTGQDISHTNGNIKDYGIMGLAFQPGCAGIVSPRRLSKSNLEEQFIKLCCHELGHTMGLPHCPEKSCYMRDAEGKNNFDTQTAFCPSCRKHLIKKGWKL